MADPYGTPAHSPGWYEDPYRRAARRYWDGRVWTAHVVDHAGSPRVDDPRAAVHQQAVAGEVPPVLVQNVVHAHAPLKSTGVALVLTFLLGPLGLLYATVGGGVVMLVVSLFAMPLTLGFAGLLIWPVCMVWAAAAVGSHNRDVVAAMSQPARYHALPARPVHDMPTRPMPLPGGQAWPERRPWP